MAQEFVTEDGVLIIPGAYSKYTVEKSNSGIAVTGVLMLVGEADAGPDYSAETNLGLNAFGPDSEADVVAKYKSGPLVDAFKAAIAATTDEEIVGSFSKAIIVKTNVSGKAQSTLKKFDGSDWAVIADRSYGKLGNLISRTVTTKQAETVPTTQGFAYLPAIAATNVNVRVNGGAATALTLAAQATPDTVASQFDGVAGVDVEGGDDLEILGTVGSPLSGNLSVAVSGNNIVLTFSVSFGSMPAAGSTLWIPAGSVVAGGGSENCGSYIVTGSTAATISATKLLDASGAPNALTPPAAVAPTASSANDEAMAFAALEIHLVTSVDPISGTGKTLEINELTTNTGLLSYLCYTLDTTPEAVTWISTAAAPSAIVSASEYIAKLTAARSLDSITEDIYAGGGIALKLGYKGTSASVVNDGTNLTITVVGGAGSSPAAIPLADHPTLSDLAAYIGSLTGFTAAPGSAVMGQQPSTSLDQGTFTFGSTFGANTGRIKQDAYKFFRAVSQTSALVQISATGLVQPASGLPAPQVLGFLSGGTKGSTTDATFQAGVDALEKARGNFLIPLFSRDAVDDIADNLTDSASSYTIDAIHAYCRAHVLKMSTLKRRRNRQAFLSKRGTFEADKTAASNLASFRCSMAFDDAKDVTNRGIVQFQPWMTALKAAAIQAAGFYRPLFRKGIAASGFLQAAGDFDSDDNDQMEDALKSGLLPTRMDENGGFYFVSDQTTYGKDSNFVYNSIQAVYVADTVSITAAQRMEKAFVGQSLADISAGMAKATLDSIMEDMRRLKLITASDDAPKGFKNVTIKMKGPAMAVSCEIKLAGALYFVPISFLVSQVQQTA